MAAPAHTFDTGVDSAHPNAAAPTAPNANAPSSTAPSGTAPNVAAPNPDVTEPVDRSGIAQKPVPERADPQQAATGPGTGTVETGNAVPFKEQAHGYAKKFHGIFTGNKDEKAYGEAKIKGEASGM